LQDICIDINALSLYLIGSAGRVKIKRAVSPLALLSKNN